MGTVHNGIKGLQTHKLCESLFATKQNKMYWGIFVLYQAPWLYMYFSLAQPHCNIQLNYVIDLPVKMAENE